MKFPISETMDQFVQASPQCPLKSDLERRAKKGERDNVVAVDIQLKVFELLNNPFLDLPEQTRDQLRNIQALAFSGYHPSQNELFFIQQSCGNNERILTFVREMRDDIELSKQHWKRTGYTGEALIFHQDIDAISKLASHLEEERIVVFGSARLRPGHEAYDGTQWLMNTLVQGLSHIDGSTEQVISGGGPGIMEAANKGAMEGGWEHYLRLLEDLKKHQDSQEIIQRVLNFRMQMQSIAIGIIVPHEQSYNEYLQGHLTIKTFSPRKMGILSAGTGRSINHKATEGPNGNGDKKRKPAIFVMTGGLGTLDELYEVATLTQCGKLKNPLPIFVVGKEMSEIVKTNMEKLDKMGTIKSTDKNLITYCNDEIEALEKYLEHYDTSSSTIVGQQIDKRKQERRESIPNLF